MYKYTVKVYKLFFKNDLSAKIHFLSKTIQITRQKNILKIFHRYQEAETRSNMSLSLLNSCQNFIIGISLVSGSLLAAFWIANWHSSSRMMSAGDYVLFSTYLLQLYAPLNFFGTIYRTMQQSFIDMSV